MRYAVTCSILWLALAGAARAIELSDIVGRWNSDSVSENIEIRKSRDVLDDRLGQGRIADGIIDNAGNLVIVYLGDVRCYFQATLIDRDHLRLANRTGPNASPKCLFGAFTRVKPIDDPESDGGKKRVQAEAAIARGKTAGSDYDRAIAEYNEAIRLDPTLAAAFDARGDAYYYKGEYDRAIADYSEAIRLDPKYAAAYSDRGLAYAKKGSYERAIADLSDAIRLAPNSARYFNLRGYVYYSKGDYSKATSDYKEAVRKSPSNAGYHLNLGTALFESQDEDAAISSFEEAIRLDPDNKDAQRWLRKARREKGLFDLEFCNKSAERVYFAIVGRRDPDDTSYTMEAWFQVEPEACKPMGKLARPSFYWMAESSTYEWTGDDKRLSWCVPKTKVTRKMEGRACSDDEYTRLFWKENPSSNQKKFTRTAR
jgi:tetratricopeptide (TPR) repeat protein